MSPHFNDTIAAWNRLLDGCQSNTQNHQPRSLFITPKNQLKNHHVYDSMNAKDDTTTRLYFQNVNGLCFDSNGGDFEELCHITLETQSDLMCIAEHNLDTTQYHISSTLTQTQNSMCRRSRLTMSSSAITMKGSYKPGGTLMLSSGGITSRYLTSGSDHLGRWTYQSFAGKKHRPVTIITAYQVCNKSPRQSGTYTAMSQQDSLLQQSGRLENPRKAFRKDLHALLKEFWNDKHQIIWVGDFNLVHRSDQSGIACLCSKFDLIDVFKHHHGSDDIPTYARGLNRRDYCIA